MHPIIQMKETDTDGGQDADEYNGCYRRKRREDNEAFNEMDNFDSKHRGQQSTEEMVIWDILCSSFGEKVFVLGEFVEGCKEWLRRIDTRKCTMNCTKLDKRLAKRCGKMRK